MCTEGLKAHLFIAFFLFGIAFPPGSCQNAEPRGSIGTRSAAKVLDLSRQEKRIEETDRRFNLNAPLEGEKSLDEDRRTLSSRNDAEAMEEESEVVAEEAEAEVAPQADGNRKTALLLGESAGESSKRRTFNVTMGTTVGRRRGNGTDRARKKRRRGKESKSSVPLYERLRVGGRNARENEIRGKRGQMSSDRRRETSSSSSSSSSSYSRKSKDPRSRKFRAERRRRRKNHQRKRGRKRPREKETVDARETTEVRSSPKLKRRMHDAPAALLLAKHEEDRNFNATALKLALENTSYDYGVSSSSSPSRNNNRTGNGSYTSTTSPSEDVLRWHHEVDSATTESGMFLESRKQRLYPLVHMGSVERELSKQLEKEIARTGLEDTSGIDRILGVSLRKSVGTYRSENVKDDTSKSSSGEKFAPKMSTSEEKKSPRFGNSRYDAAKMLGYSRTEEDLPILDLENEVLARTLKDYNAYMASNLRSSMVSRFDDEKSSYRKSIPRFHGQPIINDEPEDSGGSQKSREAFRGTNTARATTIASLYEEDDNAKGDLSCINGTFLPAPLARHALIKYVKSSIPGHEYLEADYECAPGFNMASQTSRLLCRKRQWIGQVPKCKVKQNMDGVCAEAYCEHVCKEIDARAVCSCYKGFRLDGYKCIDENECEDNNGGCEHKCVNTPGGFRCECPKGMRLGEDRLTCTDINECHLNNGHGPCQDMCRNLVGGYECSCEGLRDMVLSADNHTCQDAGPCSLNNAGCSHTCLSTMGRVFCLCPDGFMLEDDWKTCQDVDECAVPDLQTEVCRYGCINMPGSYRCAEPMELKDQPIADKLSITCLPGYEATADDTCIDINECVVDNGGCTEVCENTDGSFFCACNGDEKALSSDGKSCIDINNVACSPLNPAGRGYLMCSRLATPKTWRGRRTVTNRPGTKCFLKCPHGYQLHGEYELTCRADGTWDGPKHGECVKHSKPRLQCPNDVIAELPPGRDEAFVTFDQPATDLDWFRYVRAKPSWGTRLEANLKPGVHEITFFARHPVSKKQASCVLRIVVKGGEAPKVKDCPKDIEVNGKNGTAITWAEPIFTDNVKVMRISSNKSPGGFFDIGGHKVEYEAVDDAGWSSKCVFTVVLRQG